PPCSTWLKGHAWRSRTRWCSAACSRRRGARSTRRSRPTRRNAICAPRASRSLRGSSATSSTRKAARATCAITSSRRGRPRPSGKWTGFTGGSRSDAGDPRAEVLRLFLLLVLVPVSPDHPYEADAEAEEKHSENDGAYRIGLDRRFDGRALGVRRQRQREGYPR